MNRSRTFWLPDNKFASGVAPPTAFVVIRVPPGAGTNSLFPARYPARSSVIGPLPPGRPRPPGGAKWQWAQELSLKWMPSPVVGVWTSSKARFAASNCFWGRNPFCNSKLGGASCVHAFEHKQARAKADSATKIAVLLTNYPPIQAGALCPEALSQIERWESSDCTTAPAAIDGSARGQETTRFKIAPTYLRFGTGATRSARSLLPVNSLQFARFPKQQMPLGPGTRLEPYEIQSALGAGGMGEAPRLSQTLALASPCVVLNSARSYSAVVSPSRGIER